jgi:hypothetical protein
LHFPILPAEEGVFYTRSLIGRIVCWLGGCRLVGRFRRHGAKHNLRAQQAGQADDVQDVESGQHESKEGQHSGKGPAALHGGRGDVELPPDGAEHESGRRRFRSIFGLPMLSPGTARRAPRESVCVCVCVCVSVNTSVANEAHPAFGLDLLSAGTPLRLC